MATLLVAQKYFSLVEHSPFRAPYTTLTGDDSHSYENDNVSFQLGMANNLNSEPSLLILMPSLRQGRRQSLRKSHSSYLVKVLIPTEKIMSNSSPSRDTQHPQYSVDLPAIGGEPSFRKQTLIAPEV